MRSLLRSGNSGDFDGSAFGRHRRKHVDHCGVLAIGFGLPFQIVCEGPQSLFASHDLGLVRERDNALLIAPGTPAEDRAVGTEGLLPEVRRA
jgi:hypothetical protein